MVFFASGQTSTVATFTGGNANSDFNFNPDTSSESTCATTLLVNVPTGRFVTSVDVEYDFTATGTAWMIEQKSYLECVTKGTKEGSVSNGPAQNIAGTHAYTRTGLALANGLVPTGGLTFKLHAFRTFGGGACNATFNFIPNSTFKVTVHHIAAPTCLPPTSLQLNSVTANSATVGWTTGGATNWQIEYGPIGFTVGTGTRVSTTTNPVTLTGLNASTSYEIIVRDSCGATDVSLWSSRLPIKTACSTINAPWFENFSSADWQAGGFNNNGAIDTCFQRNHANFFTYISGPPLFASNFSGPSGDHTTGSGKYIFSERVTFGVFPATAEIVSPVINTNPLTTPELSFWYHMFGGDIGTLTVEISTNGGVNYTTLQTVTGQKQTSKTDPWKESIISLASYANSNVTLRFRSTQTSIGVNGDLALDDISIHEQPNCPKPQNLTVNAITNNSATLGWQTGGAVNWNIEYGPVGFTVGTGTKVTANSNPFTITGLLANTGYSFYVRDSCGPTDVSAWQGPTSDTTKCNPVLAPYFLNFNGAIWVVPPFINDNGNIAACWNRDVSLNYQFKPSNGVATVTTGPASGSGKFLASERMFGATQPSLKAVIESRLVNTSPLTIPELSFKYHMFGADIDSLVVEVSNGLVWASEMTLTMPQQTSKADAWKEAFVDLSAYANNTVQVRFTAYRNSTFAFNSVVAIDDFSIHEQPSCPKPQALALDLAWHDKVTLSWLSGGASNWEIEYGTTGFTVGTGTRVPVSTNPATITGLSANLTYDFYVRDSCGLGDVSSWEGPLNVKTLCLPSGIPYNKGFGHPSFSPGTNFNDPGSVHNCWSRSREDLYVWKGGPNIFANPNTGPDVDHSTGTAAGKFIYTQSIGFSASTPIVTEIESDLADVTSLTTPELSFWYHMFGANIGDLELFVTNGSTWTSVWTKVGQQQTSGATPWKEAIVNLAAYAGDTIRLKFVATKSTTGNSAEIALDDINIHEQPTCPKPQNLVLVGMTNSTATLQWQTGGATNWQIEYGGPGFTLGTGTVVNANANPFILTGLTANTNYQFYVRDSCGATDVSPWQGPVSGRTNCNPIAAPHLQTFDGSAFTVGTFPNLGGINPCWTRDASLNYVFSPEITNTIFSSGPSADHTSGSGKFMSALRQFGTATPSQMAEFESPLIDLSPLTIPELSFWYHMFGADIDSLTVEVFDGNVWSKEVNLAGNSHISKTDPWKERVVDISAYANDTIKVRFKAYRNSTFAFNSVVGLDDFDIHEQPTCPKPQSLVLLGMTNSTATLQWQSGGASNWQIEYGGPGFTLGTGTMVNAGSNPFTVTGLSANTSYDFYVRDSCGTTDVSAWHGLASGRTDCNPITAPHLQTFDGAAFTVGTFPNLGGMDPCWLRDASLNYVFTPEITNTIFASGPSADHTSGSGKFISSLRQFGTATQSQEAVFISPLIDLSPLTIPELSFWYHMFGVDIDSLNVSVFDGQSWNNELTITGGSHLSKTDPWTESIINMSAYANDTVKVRFRAYRNSTFAFNSVVGLDDFDIHEQPTCPKPSNLQVMGQTANSVSLSWTSGGATDWQIEYGINGFTLGTGTIVSAGTNPFTVSGLNSSTTYDFYVRDSCSATDKSDWFGFVSQSTDCLPVLAPYFENFDGNQWLTGVNFNDTGSVSPCWDRTPNSIYFWKPGPPFFISTLTGPSGDHTTGNGKYIYTESLGFGGAPNTAIAETPFIDLSSLTVPELRFYYHMFGATIGNLNIEIDNGSGYTSLGAITGQQHTAQALPWTERAILLSAYANDTVRIRFRAVRTVNGTLADIAIDDVEIREAPSCFKPQNVVVSNPTLTSLNVSWTTGGATNWIIGYRASGSPAPYTLVPVNANPWVITGLSPSTNYEVVVKDSCGIGDASEWSTVTYGTTLCGVVTAPFYEDFDGGVWQTGIGFNNVGHTISPCWTRPSATNPNFSTRIGATQTFNSGPLGDAGGNGGYLFTESNGGIGAGEVTTPAIYIPSTIQNPRLKMAYHMFGADITSLQVKISTGGSFGASLLTKTGAQQVANGDAWKVDSISLNSFKGDTIRIKFIGTNTGFSGDIAIDDVYIYGDPQPVCPDPSAIAFSNLAGSSLDVSWTSPAGNSQVNVYGFGQLPSSGTTYFGATSPTVITGLTANTKYVVCVRDSCTTGSLSNWICDTVSTLNCSPVVAGFTFSANTLQASFNSGNTTGADSLYWTFGDGNNTSGVSPSHGYGAAGSYTVTMIGFNSCGDSDTLQLPIIICDSLIADFTYSPAGGAYSFDGSASSGANNYRWDFASQHDTTGMVVVYGFPSPGTKPVTLWVYNACGDSASITKNVVVCLPPVASWTYNVVSTTSQGMLVQFDGSASQNAVGYDWDFGDGNTTTGSALPQNLYLTPGLFYTVRLTVTNTCGEKDSKTFRLDQIGLSELDLTRFNIYPNPAEDWIKVTWESGSMKPQKAKLYSLEGKLLLQHEVDDMEEEMELDVEHLPKGSYLLRLENAGGSSKHIIQKK